MTQLGGREAVTTQVFDGHNDSLLRLHRNGGDVEAFTAGTSEGHIDLPRAQSGGLAAGLFAIFVPGDDPATPPPDTTSYALPLSPPVDPVRATDTAGILVDLLFRLEEASTLQVVRTMAGLEACFTDGSLGAVLHLEGAEAVADPDALERWYARGLRSLGLVWSRPNRYAQGVPFHFPGNPDTGPGLTAAGRDLVRRCNDRGILVDLSHLNLRGFFEVASLSDAPLVASHSNAHALCPSTRNLTDEQLDAVASSGGLVGVNFASGFLRADGRVDPNTPLEAVIAHVAYLVERMGIEHVGFGSDFDGAQIPDAIGDVAGLPSLISALRDHGYDEEALTKLTHGNWLRVLGATWRD